MPAAPDHVAVRLVGEDDQVGPPDQAGSLGLADLLVLAVRPYIGPGSYADGGARPASGEPVATITLSRWRTPPTDAPSRPTRPSSFTVDGTGLAGRLNGQGIPAAGGKVSISGSWNCLPLR